MIALGTHSSLLSISRVTRLRNWPLVSLPGREAAVGEIRMSSTWRIDLARDSLPARHRAIKSAEDVARRLCPIDTGALESTIEGEADAASMDCRLSAGDAVVDYAAVVEVGGRPHTITAHGRGFLKFPAFAGNDGSGGVVFARSVRHPGTPAQPYLRPGVASIGGFSG